MQTCCYYVYHSSATAKSDELDMLQGNTTFADYKMCVCVCSYNLWHMHMPDLSGNPRQLSAETTSQWSRGMTLEHINVMCGNNTNR